MTVTYGGAYIMSFMQFFKAPGEEYIYIYTYYIVT